MSDLGTPRVDASDDLEEGGPGAAEALADGRADEDGDLARLPVDGDLGGALALADGEPAGGRVRGLGDRLVDGEEAGAVVEPAASLAVVVVEDGEEEFDVILKRGAFGAE